MKYSKNKFLHVYRSAVICHTYKNTCLPISLFVVGTLAASTNQIASFEIACACQIDLNSAICQADAMTKFRVAVAYEK